MTRWHKPLDRLTATPLPYDARVLLCSILLCLMLLCSIPLCGIVMAGVRTASGAERRSTPDTPGASPAAPSARPLVGEPALVQAILRDLERADEGDRPFLRYFSLAHLSNAGVPDDVLAQDRAGLARLLNSLSWHPRVWKPQPVDERQTLLRIDLRWFRWTPGKWGGILARYPYAVRAAGAERIEKLSGASVPYVRADWFAAAALAHPLYEQLLSLPKTSPELEKLLGVEAAVDLEQERDTVRAGIHRSGETGRSRIVERHLTPFGGYWKTLDSPDTSPGADILKDPVRVTGAQSEAIFSLPNGMQGFFVRHGTDLDARTCAGCHSAGVREIRDEVRLSVLAQLPAAFDRDKALALYPEQPALEALLAGDRERLRDAFADVGKAAAGAVPPDPITSLAAAYDAPLSLDRMAAEVGLDPRTFHDRLAASPRLRASGFAQSIGGTSRARWEGYFLDVVDALGLGDPVGSEGPFADYADADHHLNPENGHYYQAVAVPGGDISWTDANEAAGAASFHGYRGHLATITSASEGEFVVGHFPSAVEGSYWIGGYQDKAAPDFKEPGGGWRWVTGEPWGYTNWNPGEPNNSSGVDDFIELTSGGRWNDQKNDQRFDKVRGYVVEFEPSHIRPAVHGIPVTSGLSPSGRASGPLP